MGYFSYLRKRRLTGWLYRRLRLYPRLCKHLEGRVLDVGCGIGDFLNFRSGTVGVDIDASAVAWCRNLGLDAHLMTPDALPFDNATFDAVVLDNVLEHLAAPNALLSDIKRVLSAHGSLIVGVPGRLGYASDPDHKIYYDETALVACLLRNGFHCEQVIHMPKRSTLLAACMRQYCLYGIFRLTPEPDELTSPVQRAALARG